MNSNFLHKSNFINLPPKLHDMIKFPNLYPVNFPSHKEGCFKLCKDRILSKRVGENEGDRGNMMTQTVVISEASAPTPYSHFILQYKVVSCTGG